MIPNVVTISTVGNVLEDCVREARLTPQKYKGEYSMNMFCFHVCAAAKAASHVCGKQPEVANVMN